MEGYVYTPTTAINSRVIICGRLWMGSLLLLLLLMYQYMPMMPYHVAYKFALKGGYNLDASQELVALGVASIASAFSGNTPTHLITTTTSTNIIKSPPHE